VRIKIFYHDSCKTFEQFQTDINLWLMEHEDIEIISADRIPGSYSILYKEMSVGNDSDEVD
jgi:hypothetical protein